MENWFMYKFDLTPKLLYRAGSVDRWQIVRTIRHQTLAEHSFMVAMLSLFVCDEIGVPERMRYSILLHALHHDLPEIITGDMSTVAKDIIKNEGCVQAIEAVDNVFPKVPEIAERVGNLGRRVVKLADLIDAIVFLDVEGVGSHSKKVKKRIKKSFNAYIEDAEKAWPDLSWSKAKNVLDNALNGEDIVL